MARSGPRPQFMPTMSAPAARRFWATSAGLSPHIVRSRSCISSYWKNMVAMTGRSVTALHARTAAVASCGNIMVSTAKRSTPPSARAAACSRNVSKYSSSVVSPSGSYSAGRRLVGPIDPATYPSRGAAARARRAPFTFSSRVRSPSWYSLSLRRVPQRCSSPRSDCPRRNSPGGSSARHRRGYRSTAPGRPR